MNDFEKLVAGLAAGEGDAGTAGVDMAKSTAAEGAVADDKKVEAAAADPAAGADAGADDKADDADGDEDDADMAKSFTIKLADGTEIPAMDGAELIKSLTDRVERLEGGVVKLFNKAQADIASKDEMIKSLNGQVEKLSNAGKGRKAVVTVTAQPAAQEKKDDGITPGEFLAKSTAAHVAGKISGEDVSRIEAYMNRGIQLPQDLIAKVLS